MASQQTLLNWNRTPQSDTFNALSSKVISVASVGAGVANTAIQAGFLIPGLFKIRKVGVYYATADSVAGTDKFNLVVGTGAYTQGTIAPNDNSFSSGTQAPTLSTTTGAGTTTTASGVGYPTNVAVAGMAVFSADITIAPAATTAQQAGAATNSTYAPGWIAATTTGGYGVFVPPNYDAVYPGLLPMTLRMVTTASTGAITLFSAVLEIVLITPLANPGSLNAVVPGVCF